MAHVLERWFRKYFTDPEGIILAVLLILGFTTIIMLGDMLAPVLASVVIAYLLEGLVGAAERKGVPRMIAVGAVFSLFLAFLLFLILGLAPLLSKQLAELVQEIPSMVGQGQNILSKLPESYPGFISESQISEVMANLRSALTESGQQLLSFSLASISHLFTLLIYLVLLPVLVFFFMKDKFRLIDWFTRYLPKERGVSVMVWHEMDRQIGNYVRGKFAEILIVGLTTYIAFSIMDLNYAPLLAALVGLSVVVPYIGAVVVTLPVLLIGFFQWGWGETFAYLALVYFVIQALDGNLLVPWLFSEAVNLHPIAIIVSILIFGGIWGFWGVFFAIPLATLVKAVLDSWPKVLDDDHKVEPPL